MPSLITIHKHTVSELRVNVRPNLPPDEVVRASELIKSIPGCRRIRRGMRAFYHVPFSDEVAARIRVMGTEASIDAEVEDMLSALATSVDVMVEDNNTNGSTYEGEIDCPFKTEPMDHQIEALRFLRNREFAALLYEMGTGKTKIVMDTLRWWSKINNAPSLGIVVAPRMVLSAWQMQAPIHLGDDCQTFELESRSVNRCMDQLVAANRAKDDSVPVTLVLTTYDRVRGLVEEGFQRHLLPTHIILDESHRIRNNDSKRSIACVTLGKWAREIGARRLILTGTPLSNSLADLYPQFEFLKEGILGASSFDNFCKRYVRRQTRRWAVSKELKDKVGRMISPHSIVKRKEECITLPPSTVSPVLLRMTDQMLQTYTQLEDWFFYDVESENEDESASVQARSYLARMTRFSQLTAGVLYDEESEEARTSPPYQVKADAIEEIMGDVDDRVRAVIWTRFRLEREVIKTRLEKLRIPSTFLDGTTKDAGEIVRAFNSDDDPLRVVIADPRSASEGIDLIGSSLRPCSVIIEATYSYSWFDREQMYARSIRKGSHSPVTIYRLTVVGTLDEIIDRVLQRKGELADSVVSKAAAVGMIKQIREERNKK